MRRFLTTVVPQLLLLGVFSSALISAQTSSSVRGVHVLGSGKDAVEIEIEASDRLVPQTQVLTGPDRLVVDFPNALPGAGLRNQSVNRGEVKSVRIGLLQSNPPVTRLVLDLKTPQSYQIFPYGRTVIIKVSGGAQQAAEPVDDFPPTRPGLVNTSFTAHPFVLQTDGSAKPSLDVSFHDGLLSIRAYKASLSEVLFAVHQRTGAEVAISAGAEQEQVVADIGPAPAPEVLARLLNGSKFNFLILSSTKDPRMLDRVILSPRTEGAVISQPPMQGNDEADDEPPSVAVQSNPPPQLPPGPEAPARPQPEVRTPSDDSLPD
jgi:AMIN domain